MIKRYTYVLIVWQAGTINIHIRSLCAGKWSLSQKKEEQACRRDYPVSFPLGIKPLALGHFLVVAIAISPVQDSV